MVSDRGGETRGEAKALRVRGQVGERSEGTDAGIDQGAEGAKEAGGGVETAGRTVLGA